MLNKQYRASLKKQAELNVLKAQARAAAWLRATEAEKKAKLEAEAKAAQATRLAAAKLLEV